MQQKSEGDENEAGMQVGVWQESSLGCWERIRVRCWELDYVPRQGRPTP